MRLLLLFLPLALFAQQNVVTYPADQSKTISTATQAALDLKAPLASPTFTGTLTSGTIAHLGETSISGWSPTTEGGCATNADLVIDGTNNKKVTSAAYTFVAADIGGWIDVTAGTGWTVARYYISNVTAGAAILFASPGAVSITGGTYVVNRGRNVFTKGTTDDTLRVCAIKANTYGWQAAW